MAHSADIDWRELHEAAARFQWSGALAAVRYGVERRLELTLPNELGPAAHFDSGRPVKKGAERAWNELRTLGFRGRVLLVKAWLLPDPAYLRWKYEPRWNWAWPAYYLVRWAQSVLSGVGFVLRRLRRERISEPVLVQSRHIT